MPRIDVLVETKISTSVRARQLEAMFDVPAQDAQSRAWRFDADIESRPWNVGLIVGPSGAGKTTIAKSIWPREYAATFDWGATSVIDDFAPHNAMSDISAICQAVGFNTIPAWLRPYAVLSNGEKFRVEIARRLADTPPNETIVCDEFTSVVDRQVAQIGSHAVQKYARTHARQFVAVTCHYDVEDWLNPDWVIDAAAQTFTWRSLRRRPSIDIEIARVDYSAWRLFAPFHYLTAELHRSAACYVLYCNGAPAAFAGILFRPHPKTKNVWGVSRLVTLPDYQGLGLAFVLVDTLGACYTAKGHALRTYPAHPALIRGFAKSKNWALKKSPGYNAASPRKIAGETALAFGGRPCAVFAYAGPAADRETSIAIGLQ